MNVLFGLLGGGVVLFFLLGLLNRGISTPGVDSHPFFSDVCLDILEAEITSSKVQFPKHDAYVILPLRNPKDHLIVIEAVRCFLLENVGFGVIVSRTSGQIYPFRRQIKLCWVGYHFKIPGDSR